MFADRMSARVNEMWLEPPISEDDMGDAVASLLGVAIDPLCDRLAAAASTGGGDAAHVAGMALCVSALEDPTEESMLRREIGLSWLYIAACRGHSGAAMEIGRAISVETSSETPRRPQAVLSEISNHWFKVGTGHAAGRSVAGPPVGSLQAEARRQSGIPRVRQPVPLAEVARSARDERAAKPVAPKRGRIVLRNGIGDPNSNEGVALAKRYAVLLAGPVPCVGRVPEPGEIMDYFDRKLPWAMNVARHLQSQADKMTIAGVGQTGNLVYGMGAGAITIEPILLVGDPGAGKTRMAKSIAELLGLPRHLVPCGGAADHGGLAAFSRGWSTARACAPVQTMAEHNCANPLLILDEIDKASRPGGQNGSVMATALAMLDNAQEYGDSCLMAPVDISCVSYIATANDEKLLDSALLDRFDVQRIPRPEPKHIKEIIETIRQDEIERFGVHPSVFPEATPSDIKRFRALYEKSNRSLRVLKKAYRSMMGIQAGLQLREDMAENRILN